MNEASLRLKLKKYYYKLEEECKEQLARRISNVSDEKIEEYMKENGIDNPEEDLVEFEMNKRANAGAEWLMTVSDDKLFEMAQWNQNKMSHVVVEHRYGVKLEKVMKKRRPQLQEIAKKNNISF